jgi:hypothetical protein
MTYVDLRVPAKMRLKTIAKLFVVSIVMLTGSPALPRQIASPNADSYSCEQKAYGCRHPRFETRIAPQSGAPRQSAGKTTHDDWPANMILGSWLT